MSTTAPSPHHHTHQFRLLRGLIDAHTHAEQYSHPGPAPHHLVKATAKTHHSAAPRPISVPHTAAVGASSTAMPHAEPTIAQPLEIMPLGKELSTVLRNTFDIISGRRRLSDIRKIATSARIQSSLITHAKSGALKGAHLQSFHPNPAASGAKVDFVGSCAIGSRVRAYTGTFTKTGGKRHCQWTLTAFKII